MAVQGLFYLFTGPTALMPGYHFACDFSLATVFGIEALSQPEYTGFFIPSLASWGKGGHAGPPAADLLPLALAGLAALALQVATWWLLLQWVRRRTGEVRVRAEMARPTRLT